jgi:hypothetical protein
MKHLKVLTALAIGVVASSSGMIQVGATTYNYFVDFSTKEVVNFNDFRQTFNEDTVNLDLDFNFTFQGSYRFDSCPTSFTLDVKFYLFGRINNTGSYIQLLPFIDLPNFPCTTTNTTYIATITGTIPSNILDTIVNDDANFINIYPEMAFTQTGATNGRTLFLLGYRFYFDLSYDFNTTYLFNYFLSDQNYVGRLTSGSWTFTGTQENYLMYVYTTAGNDAYYIINSPSTNIGTTRKKYAIDYNQEFFRGSSVGAGFTTNITGTDRVVLGSSGTSVIGHRYNYYYLNVANLAQAIVDAPLIEFTEEACGGGFLDINVGCYVNNAIAYLVNDAPIISDAFTLLNTGIELAAQTFGVIGAFSDDNVFGYLILVGFGFIAVKWFLKNDE